jgi:hypothetical protein
MDTNVTQEVNVNKRIMVDEDETVLDTQSMKQHRRCNETKMRKDHEERRLPPCTGSS